MLICYDQQSGEGCQTENPDGATQCQHCQRNLRFALHLHNPGTRICRATRPCLLSKAMACIDTTG